MTQPPRLRYVYGPVFSWRLGPSLGIDPLAQPEKQCSYNCLYCQLGASRRVTVRRRVYVPTAAMMAELAQLPAMDVEYITIAGTGEPTLAGNIGELLRAIKQQRREHVVVITNGSLLYRAAVRRDLAPADEVMVKLDAVTAVDFTAVNQPAAAVTLARLLRGLRLFRREYRGKLAVQIMFVAQNRDAAPAIAAWCRKLGADEIQLNTPRRRCACPPLSAADMAQIKTAFLGLPVISVYEARSGRVAPLDAAATERRHGA